MASFSMNNQWPQKTMEMHNHHMDSTVWNKFKPRKDDIVIGTYAKSGTTWMQNIVAQLIFNGDVKVGLHEASQWLDVRTAPQDAKLAALEAQTHRRFIKTHLPVDALPIFPTVKYIYIIRDGRDVIMSLYNHHVNGNEEFYNLINDTPGRVGPPLERPPDNVAQYFKEWVEQDGFPFWPFFAHIRSWWNIRHLPNVLLVHFQELKDDLPGQIRRIAKFLEIEIDETTFPTIVKHCTFDYMKAEATRFAPAEGKVWNGGAQTFINKGTNGRWRDQLAAEDVAKYEAKAREEWGEELANYVATGQWPKGDTANKV